MKRSIWKKYTTYIVLAVIAVWALFLSREAEAETYIEVAPAVFYGGDWQQDHYAIMATERFAGKYDVSVILVLDMVEEEGNRGVQFSRTASYGRWDVGIGYAFWANPLPAWNTDNTFALTVGYDLGERCTARIRHWSTGGTSSHNKGLDMLTFSWRF